MSSLGSPATAQIAFHSLSTVAGSPQDDANIHGQLVRRFRAASTAWAKDASQIVRGPDFKSGSTARSPSAVSCQSILAQCDGGQNADLRPNPAGRAPAWR